MVIKILIALKQIILHYLWTLTNCNVIYYPKNYYKGSGTGRVTFKYFPIFVQAHPLPRTH